jgi:hypothetical protein
VNWMRKSLLLLSFLFCVLVSAPTSAQEGSPALPWRVKPSAETRQAPSDGAQVATSSRAATEVCLPVIGTCRGVSCAWWWRCDGLGFLHAQDFTILSSGDSPTPSSISQDSLLLSAHRTRTGQAVRFILPHTSRSGQEIQEIVLTYWLNATAVGVDPTLLIAQAVHETGYFDSWWSQPPRRNPAGLGVTGACAWKKPSYSTWQWDGTKWCEGLAFADWHDATRAHIGRVLAYSMTDEEATPQQQVGIDEALSLRSLPSHIRGTAKTPAGFDGVWAVPGVGYGARIATIAEGIRNE